MRVNSRSRGIVFSFAALALWLVAGCGGGGGGTASSQDAGRSVGKAPTRVIAKFKRAARISERAASLEAEGFRTVSVSERGGFRTLTVPEGMSPEEAAEYLRAEGLVEYAEPDHVVRAQWVPNDHRYPDQWNLTMLGMEDAWDTTGATLGTESRGGTSSVYVAVLDTGVNYTNYVDPGPDGIPDTGDETTYALPLDSIGTSFSQGWDFVNNDNIPVDDNGHGTHIAGIIATRTDNGNPSLPPHTDPASATAGIAFQTTIMPVKVLDQFGDGAYSDLANGIYWAVDHGADVINLSVGGEAASQALRDALQYARDRDVVVVAAAGNHDPATQPDPGVFYPAAYNDLCISVGAVNLLKWHPTYGNTGPEIDIVAPGGDATYGGILASSFPFGHPNTISVQERWGTSQAAAQVSAAAALMKAMGIVSPAQIEAILVQTAQDLGPAGHDNEFGNGLVRLGDVGTDQGALTVAATVTPDPPTPNFIVIDNGDPGTSYFASGTPAVWYPQTYPTNWNLDSVYRWTDAGAWYQWCPTLPQAGTYDVYVWWLATNDRWTDVSYEVTHAGAGSPTTVSGFNQRENGGEWNYLGTWDFDAGSGGCVKLLGSAIQSVSADAVKFELQSGSGSNPTGDLNADGCVDVADVGLFAAQFGDTVCSGGCSGDLDPLGGGDGDVDGMDLDVLMQNLGAGCP